MLTLLLAGSACAATAGIAYLSPHSLRYLETRSLDQAATRTRSLVLTYDDGPGLHATPQIAAILAARGAKATFFLLGSRAEHHPEIVDSLLIDGHELACHTYDHTNAWKVAPWKSIADINRGYCTLARWIGSDGPFRPPYGKMTLPTWLSLRRRAARTVWWTIDSGDTWARLPKAADIVERVKRSSGGVVLMHDFDRSADRVAFVCDLTSLLLDTAASEGLTVRRAGDLWTQTT